jgi:hypothetical protein
MTLLTPGEMLSSTARGPETRVSHGLRERWQACERKIVNRSQRRDISSPTNDSKIAKQGDSLQLSGSIEHISSPPATEESISNPQAGLTSDTNTPRSKSKETNSRFDNPTTTVSGDRPR